VSLYMLYALHFLFLLTLFCFWTATLSSVEKESPTYTNISFRIITTRYRMSKKIN